MLQYMGQMIETFRENDGTLKLSAKTAMFNKEYPLLHGHSSIKEETGLFGHCENIADIVGKKITGHPLNKPQVKSSRYISFGKTLDLSLEDPFNFFRILGPFILWYAPISEFGDSKRASVEEIRKTIRIGHALAVFQNLYHDFIVVFFVRKVGSIQPQEKICTFFNCTRFPCRPDSQRLTAVVSLVPRNLTQQQHNKLLAFCQVFDLPSYARGLRIQTFIQVRPID